jgi:hypothetical protein
MPAALAALEAGRAIGDHPISAALDDLFPFDTPPSTEA